MDYVTLKKRLPNYRKYAGYFILLWIVVATVMVLELSGIVRTGCTGIRVDDNGNIYVGLTEEIRVFDKSGQLLRSFSPKTSKFYVFEIDGDKLLVDGASTSYVMDLNGAVLELRPFPQLPNSMKTPKTVTIDETIYHINCSNFFYRVTVEEHGEKTVAVQMPTFDLIVEIISIVMWITGFASILILLRKLQKPSEEELREREEGISTKP